MFAFKNSIGIFAVENRSIKEEFLFEDGKEKEQGLEFSKKNIREASKPEVKEALELLSQKRYFDMLREKAIGFTIDAISRSVCDDVIIVQTVSGIDELNKIINLLVRRLREWFGYYAPEVVNSTEDNESFVKLILNNDKKQLFEKFNITKTMGGNVSEDDVKAMLDLAAQILNLYRLKSTQVEYLEGVMKRHCPNLFVLAGGVIGAKLLEQAGSLARLATMPSSTIQILGAEKALFRHLKTGSRPPKYGFLINHPFVTNAKQSDRGRVARTLADKISIAIKVDYFKGELIGEKLKKDIEKRFSQ